MDLSVFFNTQSENRPVLAGKLLYISSMEIQNNLKRPPMRIMMCSLHKNTCTQQKILASYKKL